MLATSLFKHFIRVAAWMTPHLQRWHRARNENRSEAQRHLAAGNFTEAEKYLLASAEEAQRRRSSLERKLEIQLQLAEAYRGQGKLDEAAQTVAAAAAQARAKGETSVLHARCLEALSGIHADQARLPEALEEAGRALQIARAADADPRIQAQMTRRMAELCTRAGDHDAAKGHLQRALKLYELAHGSDHPETATRLTEMGAALVNEGNYDEALVCLQRALKIHQRSTGPGSRETAQDVEHIAVALHAKGDLEAAAEHYERLLRLKDKQLGKDPREMAALLSRVADVYAELGNFSGAHETLHQCATLLDRYPEQLIETLEKLEKLYEFTGRGGDVVNVRKRMEALRAKV